MPADPLLLLAAAVATLLLGPVVGACCSRRLALLELLDGFVLVLVVGLCLGALVPHAVEGLGVAALGLVAVGLLVPSLVERRLVGRGRERILALAMLALLAHEALDGASLAACAALEPDQGQGVVLAVLAHRLPVGLLVWWAVAPTHGLAVSWVVVGLMAIATTSGFFVGGQLAEHSEGPAASALAGLLAGTLLHVVAAHAPLRRGHDHAHDGRAHDDRAHDDHAHDGHAHDGHAHDDHAHDGHAHDDHAHDDHAHEDHAHDDHAHDDRAHGGGWVPGLGALAAIAVLAALPLHPVVGALTFARTFVHLLLESAPALLVGFVAAGALSLVPSQALARLMTGRSRLGSVLRGAVFGLPLPICSCGVVPVYRGLLGRGVPHASAVAFLVAAPELGIDSVALSVPLLGVEMTLGRLAAALVVAIVAGLAADAQAAPAPERPAGERARPSLRGALRSGLVDTVDDVGPWLLLGLAIAALLDPLLAPEQLAVVPRWAQVPAMAVLAAPIYVCASAATPIAAALVAKGLSPGAAIAFLLAGPATNATTWAALRAGHGARGAARIVGALLLACVLAGWSIDLVGVAPPAAARAAYATPAAHEHPAGLVAATLVVLLLVGSLLRQGPRGFLARLGLGVDPAGHHHHASHALPA